MEVCLPVQAEQLSQRLGGLRRAFFLELRFDAGARSGLAAARTDCTYTGQYSNVADFGLMYYNARWYDPTIARFAQADSIVPEGAQGLDRYAYVNNSPVVYTDPSGHCVDVDAGLCVHEDQASGGYHIVHPGQGRFANRVEAVIADAILSGNYGGLGSVQGGAPFMLGAAIENACEGIGTDCGSYYQQVFWRMAAGLSGISASYPAIGTGPGSAPPVVVPAPLVDDIYSQGGWVSGVPRLPQQLAGGGADTFVYIGYNDRGEPVYVGITNNISRRQSEHGNRFTIVPVTTVPVTRGEARAIEQALIAQNPHFQNVNNSISPVHAYYQDAVAWGNWWLGQAGYRP